METFDGKHPCKICAKAEELRKNEGSGDSRNHPQEKKPVRFAWGEMVVAKWLVIPRDSGTDHLTLSVTETPWLPGRGMDAPVLQPPERA
jgi:hypothetical protein